MNRSGAAFLALVLAGSLPGGPCRAAEVLDPIPWQAGSYEGRVSSLETPVEPGRGGAAANAPVDTPVAISFLVLPEEGGAGKRVFLVRSAAPGADGRPLPPSGEAGLFRVAEARLVPLAGDEPSLQAGFPGGLFASSIFPVFDIPGPDGVEREERVPVHAGAIVNLPLRARAEKAGPLLTVTRSLIPGRTAPVEIDGSPSTVERWSETHVIDVDRKALLRIRGEQRIIIERGGERIAAEGSVELELKGARSLDDASRARALKLAREVQAVLDGFREKRHPREIYDLMKTLPAREEPELLRGLEDALAAKLTRYRLEREAEARREAPSRDPAPDFTLESLDGKKVSFKEATRGKVTLLTFWGYGCPPCRVEGPYLTKLQETYGDQGFTVFAVNAYDEPRGMVQAFVERGRLKYPILLMGRQVARDLYRVNRFPTSLWIDRAGNVVARESGFSPASFPRIEARVKEMLAGAKAGEGKP